jgi:CubicO group peptidase (beta-lactamase class C family)
MIKAFLAILLASVGILPAQEPVDDSAARVARIEHSLLPLVTISGETPVPMTVEQRMAHYHVPGLSVAFIDQGHIAWTRVYGVANTATHAPVTTETMFQAASISKAASALGAMRLVREGTLHLDTDVNLQLKSWQVPENQFTATQKVTLRRILSHTAGLTVSGFNGYPQGQPLPTVLQMLNGEIPANNAPIRVDTIPGTIQRYSGGGYVVMRLLMTDVTDQPFPELMDQLVLHPLGMEHSTFAQPLPEKWKKFAAQAYDIDGNLFNGGYRNYPEMAPDGLWTTPSDLARLAIEVQKENAGTSHTLLDQENMHQLLTPQFGRWGLGFELGELEGRPTFDHGGAVEGFKDRLEAFVEQGGQGIAIMTNSDGGGHLRDEYLRAVAKEYGWSKDDNPIVHTVVPIDPKLVAADAGIYRSPEFGDLTLSFHEGKLYIHCKQLDLGDEEMFPESSTQLFVLSSDLVFRFTHGSNGNALFIQTHAGAVRSTAPKVQ